ncbi:MAG: F0F1 ATP synthase subunit B [Chlorobiales bacterium]|jgi:F-type H+-transporting ATPase subunit b|nr:F0F1 ATP synthase subunit B [Chlorobiales bacterium]
MLTTGFILLEGSLISPNPGLIFWTAVTFFLLLFLLKKMAWKPILTALDERQKGIQSAIDRAEKAKADAEVVLAKNKVALEKAEAESERIIKEGREYAEKVRNEIVEKANAESRKMIEAAKAEIEMETQRALASLREEVADLAVKGAEKIIRQNLDAQKHKAVVASMLEDIKSLKN